MAKDSKKPSKKGKSPKKDKARKSNDVLDGAFQSLKKFRKVTRSVGKLSTGQKVVGGVALLAAGLTYLAKRQAAPGATSAAPGAEAAEATLASLSEPAAPATAPDSANGEAPDHSDTPEVGGKARKHR